jgi:hypothetical protein
MEAFNGSEEYEFLSRIIKKYQQEGSPCQDYIQQLNKLMTRMEKEYGYMIASNVFRMIDEKIENEIE